MTAPLPHQQLESASDLRAFRSVSVVLHFPVEQRWHRGTCSVSLRSKVEMSNIKNPLNPSMYQLTSVVATKTNLNNKKWANMEIMCLENSLDLAQSSQKDIFFRPSSTSTASISSVSCTSSLILRSKGQIYLKSCPTNQYALIDAKLGVKVQVQ